MSMKRSKQRTSGARHSSRDEDYAPFGKPPEPEPTWAEVESKPDESFAPFAMTARYAKGNLILHPKFGKGIVVSAEPTRIEVLFQDGKKKLGHASV
jgi:hypothetical protein